MQFINTPRLRIAYRQHGCPSDEPIILLHGWPDDIHTWDQLVAPLVAQNFRLIVPYLRGAGETRFLDARTPRSGQLSALAQDLLDLADALKLERFIVIGHDWGARAAYNAAVLAPDRLKCCIALSVGWGTNDPGQTLSLSQARNYWYHWYMATPRGTEAVKKERRDLACLLWQTWSPSWQFTQAEFRETTHSFDNPDWPAVTLHSYCHRWGFAESDNYYAAQEDRLRRQNIISVPTLVLHGEDDGANGVATSAHREHLFSGPYHRVVIPQVGHFPQREKPALVAAEILAWLKTPARPDSC